LAFGPWMRPGTVAWWWFRNGTGLISIPQCRCEQVDQRTVSKSQRHLPAERFTL
jgi:hypothetical protein